MAKIGANTQGDWQELDPQVAEAVRGVEQDIVVQNILMVAPADIFSLFNNTRTAAQIAADVRVNIDARRPVALDADVANALVADVTANLNEVRRAEQLAPGGNAIQRVQRQTKSFTDAIRRALPAHIMGEITHETNGVREEALPVGTWTTTATHTINAVVSTFDIDLAHPFWQNRIQSEDELIVALQTVTLAQCGITHGATPSTHRIVLADAQAIARSQSAGGGAQQLWRRLLYTNTKTLLADQQTNPLNVETGVNFVMNNPEVRKLIAPPSADTARAELTSLKNEQSIASALGAIEQIDIPITTVTGVNNWNLVRSKITELESDLRTLASATPGSTPPDTSGLLGFTLSTNPNAAESQKQASLSQLRSIFVELRKIDNANTQFSSALSSLNTAIRAVYTSKSISSPLTQYDTLIATNGSLQPLANYTTAITPRSVIQELRTTLGLRSSASEYTQAIADQDTKVKAAEKGEGIVSGRDALINVYKAYFGKVRKVDPRRTEEAAQTLYSRNEQGREDAQARQVAMQEMTGEVEPQRSRLNPRRWVSGTNEFLKDHSALQLGFTNNSQGRIIRELAQSDTIRAPGNPPKWSALNYPRLMTAFCAMRKLRDDPASKIHLRSTQYYADQMEEISNLLVDRFHEQLERDYAREPETDQQRTERRAQGEFQRRQRLTRMLTNEPLPATYEERAGAAITEATGKIRTFGDRIRQIFTGDTTRTPTGGWSPYTWPARSVKSAGKFAVNRGKNLMGEGSALNPITYPARAAKKVWAILDMDM